MALSRGLCPEHGTYPPGSAKCPACARDYGARRRAKHDPRDAIYHFSDWGRIRLHVLKRDHFKCRYQFPGCLGKANEAAHIEPPSGPDDPLAYAETNLIASCKPCNLREMNMRKHAHVVDL